MGWAYVVHGEHGGHATIPDDPSVLEYYLARGWERHALPDVLDPDAPNSAGEALEAAEVYETEQILTEDQALAKKGKELDDALGDAGLSKSGTADEKRARLAEHQAELADPTPEGEVNG